ncbi:hypothetical protein ACNH6C_13825 [Bdellovibrio bacteriovorus]|uniref:hypothetical protein n=1 Tax=Bdellovibrio bacteriovorus TaxID=959 RepID=UPI003A8015D3
MNFTEFEKALIKRSYELTDLIFEMERAFDRPFYHYTSNESSQKIIASQQFKMSFIRSTSDPLELSLILATCRDALCFTENWDGSVFPKELFKHFNDEALDPIVRPYFISMTESPSEPFLMNNYGGAVIEFSADCDFVDTKGLFADRFRVIKCRYENDLKKFVEDQISRWGAEVLSPTLKEFGIQSHLVDINSWHFALMEFCFTLALGLKSKAYFPEKEHRLLFIPRDPDVSMEFYVRRSLHPSKSRFERQREYLTLNLSKCGLKAKRIR